MVGPADDPTKLPAQPNEFFDDLPAFDLNTKQPATSQAFDESTTRTTPPPLTPAPSPTLSLPASPATKHNIDFRSRIYPALEIVQVALRVLAILLVVICCGFLLLVLIGFASSLIAGNEDDPRLILGVGLFWVGATSVPLMITSLILFSYAELIKVLLDIQKNTQLTAHLTRMNSQ